MAAKGKGAVRLLKPGRAVRVTTIGREVKATPSGMAGSMSGVKLARGVELVRGPARRRRPPKPVNGEPAVGV